MPAALSVRDALPPSLRRRVALALPVDWSARRPHRMPARDPLGLYYIAWDGGTGVYGEDWDISPRDADGVLLTHGAAPTYHPIRIAQYALHAHDAFLTRGAAADAEAFLAQARWLRDHQDSGGAYRFGFAWPKYGAPAGWCSAMAQGEAISALLRADALSPGNGFGDAAERGAAPFRRTLAEGGVTWRRGRDVFFEEAAVEPAAHILNGGIYAIFGLWDLEQAGGPAWARTILAEGLDTLERWLDRYDSGCWSYYSALATPGGHRAYATLKYHAFHIAQLRVLAGMTGVRRYAETAERWERYQRRRRSRVAVVLNEARGLWPRLVTHADSVPGGARGRF